MKNYKPGIIQLPSYLLDNAEMESLQKRLREIIAETGSDLRAQDAIDDLEQELNKRKNFKLTD